MKLPCELIQEPYLASVRRMVAKELSKKGWSQIRIASTLGVSQALVSNYLRKEKRRHQDNTHEKIESKTREVAVNVAGYFLREVDLPKIRAIETICKECKFMRAQGPFCTLHTRLDPEFGQKEPCTSCRSSPELLELMSSERYHITAELIKAIEGLERVEGVSRVVPEIGLQLVYGGKTMKSYLDIAGFPGRIGKYRGKLVRVSRPEFGASKHTSELLLLVNRIQKRIRAFGVLANRESIIDALESRQIDIVETDFDIEGKLGHSEIRVLREKQMVALISQPRIGMEGVIYLGADTPLSISQTIHELIE